MCLQFVKNIVFLLTVVFIVFSFEPEEHKPNKNVSIHRAQKNRAMETEQSVSSDYYQKMSKMFKEREKNFLANCWDISEIQLKGTPLDLCLCYDVKNQECLLNVFDFNQSSNTFSRFELNKAKMSLDSARQYIQIETLKRKYSIEEYNKRNIVDTNKLLKDLRKNYKKNASQFASEKISKKLEKIYKRYYNQYFSEAEDPVVGIIGSSDSLMISTLWTKIQKGLTQKDSSVIYGLPWIKTIGSFLDEEILQVTDSMEIGSINGPVKTSYGYFIVLLDSIVSLDSIPIEQAIPKLLRMMISEESDNSIVQKYIKSSNIENLYDTLIIKTWNIGMVSSKGNQNNFNLNINKSEDYKIIKVKDKEEFQNDTKDLNHVIISQYELPLNLGNIFSKIKNINKGNFYETNNTAYGKWYFEILDRREYKGKLSVNKIDWFTICEEHILNIEKLITEELKRRFEENQLSYCSMVALFETVDEPTDKEIIKCIKDEIIDTAKVAKYIKMLRNNLETQLEMNENYFKVGKMSKEIKTKKENQLKQKLEAIESSRKNAYTKMYQIHVVNTLLRDIIKENIELQNQDLLNFL